MGLLREVVSWLCEMRAVFLPFILGWLVLMSWALLRQLASAGLPSIIRSCGLACCALGQPGDPHSLGLLPMRCLQYADQVWARLPLRFRTLRKKLGLSEHLVRASLQAEVDRISASNDPGSLLAKILAARSKAPPSPHPLKWAA